MFLKIFLSSVLLMTSLYGGHPTWNEDFDFESVEERLAQGRVTRMIPFENFLQDNPDVKFTSQVFYVEMEDGLKAIFKDLSSPNERPEAFGEVGAYKASRRLFGQKGLFSLIPPSVLRTFGERFGSLHYYVEPQKSDAYSLSPILKSFPEETTHRLHTLWYVLGNSDQSASNLIRTTGGLPAAIDFANTCIPQEWAYGDFSFERFCPLKEELAPSNAGMFPFHGAQPYEASTLDLLDVTPWRKSSLLQRFEALQKKGAHLKTLAWRGYLWLQKYEDGDIINNIENPSEALVRSVQDFDEDAWEEAYQDMSSPLRAVLKEKFQQRRQAWLEASRKAS